ncbi:hypothetical protein CJJ19_03510 [Candidatus Williamhamiltonella defendens]|nr:hypothetical protein CJJ19_03510 [Candidatus Hamiltonella defensa]
MKTHESPATRDGRKGQQWRGSELIMQVHENRYIKRAGVAGLRARAIALYITEELNSISKQKCLCNLSRKADVPLCQRCSI